MTRLMALCMVVALMGCQRESPSGFVNTRSQAISTTQVPLDAPVVGPVATSESVVGQWDGQRFVIAVVGPTQLDCVTLFADGTRDQSVVVAQTGLPHRMLLDSDGNALVVMQNNGSLFLVTLGRSCAGPFGRIDLPLVGGDNVSVAVFDGGITALDVIAVATVPTLRVSVINFDGGIKSSVEVRPAGWQAGAFINGSWLVASVPRPPSSSTVTVDRVTVPKLQLVNTMSLSKSLDGEGNVLRAIASGSQVFVQGTNQANGVSFGLRFDDNGGLLDFTDIGMTTRKVLQGTAGGFLIGEPVDPARGAMVSEFLFDGTQAASLPVLPDVDGGVPGLTGAGVVLMYGASNNVMLTRLARATGSYSSRTVDNTLQPTRPTQLLKPRVNAQSDVHYTPTGDEGFATWRDDREGQSRLFMRRFRNSDFAPLSDSFSSTKSASAYQTVQWQDRALVFLGDSSYQTVLELHGDGGIVETTFAGVGFSGALASNAAAAYVARTAFDATLLTNVVEVRRLTDAGFGPAIELNPGRSFFGVWAAADDAAVYLGTMLSSPSAFQVYQLGASTPPQPFAVMSGQTVALVGTRDGVCGFTNTGPYECRFSDGGLSATGTVAPLSAPEVTFDGTRVQICAKQLDATGQWYSLDGAGMLTHHSGLTAACRDLASIGVDQVVTSKSVLVTTAEGTTPRDVLLIIDVTPDGGSSFDAGTAVDAGTSGDAGVSADAGAELDAGAALDAGTPATDAGTPDAGVDAGVDEETHAHRSLAVGCSSTPASLEVLTLLLVLRRLHRSRQRIEPR